MNQSGTEHTLVRGAVFRIVPEATEGGTNLQLYNILGQHLAELFVPGGGGGSGGGGSDGYWKPSVSPDGVISFVKTTSTTPPEPQNIKGADGLDGEPGRDGERGADGSTPNIRVGTTTTGEAGSEALVIRRPGSPDSDPVFDFIIPRGQDGSSFTAGSYLGTGAALGDTQTIVLGFTPSVVFVMIDGPSFTTSVNNVTNNISGSFGLATRDRPYNSFSVAGVITVVDGGFRVQHNNYVFFNMPNRAVNYLAFR